MGGVLHDVEDRHVRAIISDAYDPAKSYAVGDYCIRDNTLYKCIEETTDVWNSTSWEATNVGNEFSGLTNSLNGELGSRWISPNATITIPFTKTSQNIILIFNNGIALASNITNSVFRIVDNSSSYNITISDGNVVIENLTVYGESFSYIKTNH